jgi:DNA-binding NtrC family response regulator
VIVSGDSTGERILLVEGEPRLRRAIEAVLRETGFHVESAADIDHAPLLADDDPFAVVIADIRPAGLQGEEWLREIRDRVPGTPVIALSEEISVEKALSLTRAGAADCLTKPFRTELLLCSIQRVLDESRARRERAQRSRRFGDHLQGLVGASRPMLRLFERIGRVAGSSAPVLIRGETGTGKELVAHTVHRASGRGVFLPVNCGAIPEHLIESELFGHVKGAFTGADRDRVGLFKAADGGTLFLDEIGELPIALQPRLLRVIEHGEVRPVGAVAAEHVSVRILAATHRDLEGAVRDGSFREDLFWRINVLSLDVPALRERPTDIPLLVEHLCSQAHSGSGGERCVSPTALAALIEYPWPGNVRELRSVIERALTFTDADEVELDDLPGELRTAGQRAHRIRDAAERQLTLTDLEQEYILEVLRRTAGNKSKAAEWLGLPRRTLYRRLEEYGRGGV